MQYNEDMESNNSMLRLERLYHQAKEISLKDDQRLVIFSDFHMGNGKKRDDFNKNGLLIEKCLKHYYLERDYNLILNGDIEELLKFSLQSIKASWKPVYDIFDRFHEKGNLIKLLGNHDYRLRWDPTFRQPYSLYDAIKLHYGPYQFFIYHGHQSSYAYSHFGKLIKFFIYFFAKPLNIKNFTLAFNNEKIIAVERDAYAFAHMKGLISFIGHTHRPLFESLSNRDTLLIKLEKKLRRYSKANPEEQRKLKDNIRFLGEAIKQPADRDFTTPLNSLYSSGFIQPCLFNTGCAIGKRGITCIEIKKGKISLVHWFDYQKSPRYKEKKGSYIPRGMEDFPYYKIALKQDDLSYIYDCNRLLR